MNDKKIKILSLLDSYYFVLFFPLTKKLIKKVGVKDYLDYEISAISLWGSNSNCLDLASRADPVAFKEYIKSLTCEHDFDKIRKIINIKSFSKYSSYFSRDLIKQLIQNTKFYSNEVEKLLNIYHDLILDIIMEDIANNDIDKYISNSDIEIKKILYSYLDLNTVISLIEKNKLYGSDFTTLFDIRSKEIEAYMYNNITLNPEHAITYLSYRMPEYMYENICNMIVMDDTFFKKIFINMNNSSLKEFIFKFKYNDVINFVNILINSGNFRNLLTYSVPKEIIEYVIKSLNDNDIAKLLEERYLSSSIKEKFYELRKKDIIKVISNLAETDLVSAINLINNIDDRDLVKILVKNIDISKDTIKNLLDCNLIKYLVILYNIKKDFVIEYLLEKRSIDIDFFNKNFEYGYNERIIKDIIHDLTSDELTIIFSNYHFGLDYKDIVFSLYRDKWLTIFKDIFYNNPEKAKAILLDCGGTKFRDYVIKNYPSEYLLKLDIYYNTEKDVLFKSNNIEFRNGLKSYFENDKYGLFKLCFNFRGKESELNKYVLSLYSDDDILDVIIKNGDGNKIFTLTSNKELIYSRIRETVMTQSKLLATTDWDKYILLLKGLRSTSVNLFLESVTSLDLNDELLNKLYIERGLSDNQKEILINSFRFDITRIVKELVAKDRTKAFDYLQKGTSEDILNYLLTIITKDELKELLNTDSFVKRRSIGEKFAIKLYLTIYDNPLNVDKVNHYLSMYNGNKFEFVKNFETVVYFFNELHVNIDDFFQYSLNGTYNFIPDISMIYNNCLKDFIEFSNYFSSLVDMDDKPYAVNLLKIIKNFARYNDLCVSIARNKSFDKNNIKDVLLLFSREEMLCDKPCDISECRNIRILLQNNLREMFDNCVTLEDYKSLVSNILFNTSYKELENRLSIYGNTADLITLKYYNKNNSKLNKLIDEIIYCTSMIEDIVSCDKIDALREITFNSINNLDVILDDLNYYNYDEKMRQIYAIEMDSNLTRIDNGLSLNAVIDSDRTNKYGITIYDFSDKEYALLAHVKSDKETYDDLINGVSSGDKNFISLSAISYRKQCYYWGAKNIIFGYDCMPFKNFIFSSVDNMGTNRMITNNSSEVKNTLRTQRGIFEISDTDGNSEILALRDGIKPNYIIIPGNREPLVEELEIAKKYNLTIVYTQEKNKSIDSPKKVMTDKVIDDVFKSLSKDDLFRLRNDLISEKESQKRKVAIITDIHGLLEPAIEVLEDIRKRGITEIYSLGDNIGTGPNPEEVVDILETYGVKSIKGNHELYLENINHFMQHLVVTRAVQEEVENQKWTEEHLREDQIETIHNYEDHVELIIGGKRILLCHHIKDYNTGEYIFNPNDYDYVFEGHKHFEHELGNIFTLKAVGMGNNTTEDIGTASYTILTEEDNNIKIEPVNIKYNYKNTIASINKSNANTRVKMMRWVGSK